jgi:hypothetical protein
MDALKGFGQQLGQKGLQKAQAKGQEVAIGQSVKGAGGTAEQQAAAKALSGKVDLSQAPGVIKSTQTFFYNGFFNPPGASMLAVVAVRGTLGLIILGIVIFLVWYNWNKIFPKSTSDAVKKQSTIASNAANQLNAAVSKEGFANPTNPAKPGDTMLVDMQALTIKQAGFIGPIYQGVFDKDTGASQALRSGFRSFVLQIDYLDAKMGDDFAQPGIPTLLYRGDDGSLISNNSADINAVVTSIANTAFRPEIPNYTDPLIIYLHFVRTPSPISSPDSYIEFLSKVAAAINPLAPNHLGMTPLGTFNRQKQESNMLTTPIRGFGGQVIILCNADTSAFRKMSNINPANDLDFFVNMRVYSNETLGVTQKPPEGVTPTAIVISASTLLSMSSKEMEEFAAKAKNQYVIAMPSQMANPSPAELTILLQNTGVNLVPIDIFSDNIDTTKQLLSKYNNKSFSPKIAGLRNTQ